MLSDPIGVEHLFGHGVCSTLLICDGETTLDVFVEVHLLASLGVICRKDRHEEKLVLILLSKRSQRLDKLSAIVAVVEEYLGQWFLPLESSVDVKP